VHEAQQYIADGHDWVVDLNLERFFGRVNHDRLLAAVAKRVADKRNAQVDTSISGGRTDGGWVGEVGG
jgi:retron-type reverse transcriptase